MTTMYVWVYTRSRDAIIFVSQADFVDYADKNGFELETEGLNRWRVDRRYNSVGNEIFELGYATVIAAQVVGNGNDR